MKKHLVWLLCYGLIGIISTFSAGRTMAQNYLGRIERNDPAFDKLLPQDSQLEILAEGFTWTEGPLWRTDDRGGYLLFTDIPRNSIFSWRKGEGIKLFMNPSGYTGIEYYGLEPGANGLLQDSQGRLVMCEHGDRRVSVLTNGGGKRTLVDNYQGKRLNSPNDGVCKSNGDIYFTDPPYGLPKRYDDPRRELEHCGVYRISQATGELTLLSTALARPNGIGFSPDEKTLYVAQSDPENPIWMSFPVKDDGTLGEGKVFASAKDRVIKDPGLPDGMAIDRDGNVWASGPGGIWVFSPAGKLLGKIFTGERTSNCTFGEDGKTLFVTADTYLCRIRTSVIGTKVAGVK
jgi:gluconolactonase